MNLKSMQVFLFCDFIVLLNLLCRIPTGLQLQHWSRWGKLSSRFTLKFVYLFLFLPVTDALLTDSPDRLVTPTLLM